MADILANPVDICFGSMLATSTAPAACLVIEGNAITTNQQIETDLSSKTRPPTPSDLIVGIHRVESMLSDTIKIRERVKRPRTTSSTSSMPLGLRNTAHIASCYMKSKIQIESGPKTQDRGNCMNHLDEPCPREVQAHSTPMPCPQEASSTAHHGSPPPDEPRVVSRPPCVPGRPYNNLPELSGRRVQKPRSPDLGCLRRRTTARWRNR
jgi:hypothetical protein